MMRKKGNVKRTKTHTVVIWVGIININNIWEACSVSCFFVAFSLSLFSISLKALWNLCYIPLIGIVLESLQHSNESCIQCSLESIDTQIYCIFYINARSKFGKLCILISFSDPAVIPYYLHSFPWSFHEFASFSIISFISILDGHLSALCLN